MSASNSERKSEKKSDQITVSTSYVIQDSIGYKGHDTFFGGGGNIRLHILPKKLWKKVRKKTRLNNSFLIMLCKIQITLFREENSEY